MPTEPAPRHPVGPSGPQAHMNLPSQRPRERTDFRGLVLVLEGCALAIEGVRDQIRAGRGHAASAQRLDDLARLCREIAGELQAPERERAAGPDVA